MRTSLGHWHENSILWSFRMLILQYLANILLSVCHSSLLLMQRLLVWHTLPSLKTIARDPLKLYSREPEKLPLQSAYVRTARFNCLFMSRGLGKALLLSPILHTAGPFPTPSCPGRLRSSDIIGSLHWMCRHSGTVHRWSVGERCLLEDQISKRAFLSPRQKWAADPCSAGATPLQGKIFKFPRVKL